MPATALRAVALLLAAVLPAAAGAQTTVPLSATVVSPPPGIRALSFAPAAGAALASVPHRATPVVSAPHPARPAGAAVVAGIPGSAVVSLELGGDAFYTVTVRADAPGAPLLVRNAAGDFVPVAYDHAITVVDARRVGAPAARQEVAFRRTGAGAARVRYEIAARRDDSATTYAFSLDLP